MYNIKPEVLSRCSTPLSPGGSMLANSIANIAVSDLSHSLQISSVQLPFIETDTSAASKQEHVISVVSILIIREQIFKFLHIFIRILHFTQVKIVDIYHRIYMEKYILHIGH